MVEMADLGPVLAELYDKELIFHGFTPYMRDYEMVLYEPSTRTRSTVLSRDTSASSLGTAPSPPSPPGPGLTYGSGPSATTSSGCGTSPGARPATSGGWRPRRSTRVPRSSKAPSERRTGPTSSGPRSTRSWSRPTPRPSGWSFPRRQLQKSSRLCALHRCVRGSRRNLRRGPASAVRTQGPSTRTGHPMGHARARGPSLAQCASEGRCGIRIVDRLYWSLQ